MTRPLSPAARAVLATVRAACRAGRVDLADQADGSTLVVVLSDDGADLLRAVVRSVVRVGDPRQLALPGVPVVPRPAVVPQPVELDAADLVVPARRWPLAEGDVIAFGDERCSVIEVNRDGPILRAEDGEELTPLWTEIEEVSPGVWRDRPLPGSQEERAKSTPKPRPPAKAKPARLTAEPEADALAVRGVRCVITQLHEGDPWELMWSDEMPRQMVCDEAWKAVQEQAARARRYNRGRKCVADTKDGGAS